MLFSNFGTHMAARTFFLVFVLVAVSAESQQQTSSAKAHGSSLMQLSLETKQVKARSEYITAPWESAPLGARDFLGDLLAFATAICSFAMCRLVLLPILVPAAGQAVKTEGLETVPEEDEQLESEQEEKDGQEKSDKQREGVAVPLTAAPISSRQKEVEHTTPRGKVSSKAAEDSQEESVKTSKHWLSKEEKDPFGCTALHLAAHAGEANGVAELLDAGYNPNAQENLGETPLHLAVRAGCTECVQALLAGGARVNVRNKFGKTAMGVVPQENRALYELLRTGSKR